MNILGHPMVKEAAVYASELVPLLKEPFDSLLMLHQSSQTGSRHPIVEAHSSNGFIYISPLYY